MSHLNGLNLDRGTRTASPQACVIDRCNNYDYDRTRCAAYDGCNWDYYGCCSVWDSCNIDYAG